MPALIPLTFSALVLAQSPTVGKIPCPTHDHFLVEGPTSLFQKISFSHMGQTLSFGELRITYDRLKDHCFKILGNGSDPQCLSAEPTPLKVKNKIVGYAYRDSDGRGYRILSASAIDARKREDLMMTVRAPADEPTTKKSPPEERYTRVRLYDLTKAPSGTGRLEVVNEDELAEARQSEILLPKSRTNPTDRCPERPTEHTLRWGTHLKIFDENTLAGAPTTAGYSEKKDPKAWSGGLWDKTNPTGDK